MVVCDDGVNAEGGGIICLLCGCDAAVHRDNQGYALLMKPADSSAIEAVALIIAIRNIPHTGDTFGGQIVCQEAGGGDAVHVIVSVNGGFFSVCYGLLHTFHCLLHPKHPHGIVQQFALPLNQGTGTSGCCNAANGKHRGKQGRVACGKQIFRNFRNLIFYFPFVRFHVSCFPLKFLQGTRGKY